MLIYSSMATFSFPLTHIQIEGWLSDLNQRKAFVERKPNNMQNSVCDEKLTLYLTLNMQ